MLFEFFFTLLMAFLFAAIYDVFTRPRITTRTTPPSTTATATTSTDDLDFLFRSFPPPTPPPDASEFVMSIYQKLMEVAIAAMKHEFLATIPNSSLTRETLTKKALQNLMEAISAVNLFMSTRKAQMGDNLVRMNKLLMDVMAETMMPKAERQQRKHDRAKNMHASRLYQDYIKWKLKNALAQCEGSRRVHVERQAQVHS